MLTSELFRFEPIEGTKNHRLFLGTDKFPAGELKFTAHREYGLPNTITVSRQNGEWHLSFNYATNDSVERLTEQELLDYYSSLAKEELETVTVGGDRGVVIPLVTSDGITHAFTDREKVVLAAKERGRIR
jgi:putative transposase